MLNGVGMFISYRRVPHAYAQVCLLIINTMLFPSVRSTIAAARRTIYSHKSPIPHLMIGCLGPDAPSGQ